MKRKLNGSVTVEAALLYPFLLTITFLTVQLTLHQYNAVGERAAKLYDTVFTERKFQASELVRASDAAFDFFGK